MDTSTIIMIVLLAAFLVFRLMPVKGIRNISTIQLKNELGDKNKEYIDVRTPMEFKGRSIKGFKNIPVINFQVNHQLFLRIRKLS